MGCVLYEMTTLKHAFEAGIIIYIFQNQLKKLIFQTAYKEYILNEISYWIMRKMGKSILSQFLRGC